MLIRGDHCEKTKSAILKKIQVSYRYVKMKAVLLILISIGSNLAQNFNNLFVCPDDWIPNGDRCYQFSFQPRNYDDAAHICQKNGAILLSIDDIAENTFVLAHLRKVDNQRLEWYTSGERDSSTVIARYVWTATNQEISLTSDIWIDRNEPINSDITRDILVLKYDARRGLFGVAAVSGRYELRNFICEISRNEVYRININKRGFDYGTSFKNLNDVQMGPKFIVEAESTVVISDKAEGMVYMECIASGIPQPEYKWITYISGEVTQIESKIDPRYTITNGKFTIEDPSEAKDAGVYQCLVENSVGAIISAPAQLSFASLGEFPNIQAAPVNPLEYQGAVIECPDIPSRFSQAVVYQWKKSEEDRYTGDIDKLRKSDVRPDLNNRLFVSGNGKLYFSEVTRDDNFYYYCIATLTTLNLNQNFMSTTLSPSRTSKPVRLEVRASAGGTYEPRIQDSFINVIPGSPVVGMNISLECFAYGTLPLTYEWEVPQGVVGRYELTDSNRILKINNVQQDDSGEYSCRVTSSKGSGQQADKKSYVLYVESQPDFIVPLTDQHLDKGTRQLTWRCEARAVPFPTYTWYKNAQVIQNSTDGDRLVIGNTLFLRNLQHERDSGMYQCVAQNSHGVTSTSAQLRILEVKPTFAKFPVPSTMAGAVGGNITIPCRPEAAPFPEISWYRNGANLNPGTDSGSRLQLTIEGDLKIRDLSMGDQGNYECRAMNELGEDRNRTFLTIMQRTTIYQPPRPQSVEVNKTAFLYCQASFNQNKLDLIYMWAFNGRVIDIERNEHYRRGNTADQEGGLYLIFAQYDHSGMYTCIAQTQVDSANASAALMVTGPPGEPAGVEAYSASDKISEQVSDELGVGDTDVVLRWTDPVDTHGAPILTYMIYGQTNYSNEWKPLYTYIPQMNTVIMGSVDSQRRQFLARNLSPGVGYSFKVKAVNMYGVGLESEPTKRTTIPGSHPTKPPRNVGGGGGSVGTLRMTWDALPPEDHNGWGIGYIVEYRRRPPPGEELTSNIKWNKIEVQGNGSEASALVGKDNYYLLYQVKVTAFNKFGVGPTAQNDSVYSAEDMPIGIPSNLYAEPYNESAIIVHWDPVPLDRTFMKGQLKGFKIDYWLRPPNSTRNSQTIQNIENRIDAKQAVFYGAINEGMIIGLTNNTWYTMTVTVFNNAGNGLKSEVAHQKTDKAAPRNYPVHILVFPNEENSILVRFRGVSTTVDEEPLLGYKIRYWRDTEDIRNATDIYIGKDTEGTIHKIQEGYLYHLRVLGYSVGGDGKMSSPETLFTYSRGRVTQVNVDPTTTNVTYVTHDMRGSGRCLTSYIMMIVTSLLMLITL
ncbi:contactin-4-like isoform X2 [Ruditapes philippinarum]|uniref:contactin-4-like isoform X2 n=1 Tax=Ruditapes philippinarum TaxID=129788 RepID=UPI00295B3B1B|nr:contactin-4-like isoform X2 [Ruditapes philippinarum]